MAEVDLESRTLWRERRYTEAQDLEARLREAAGNRPCRNAEPSRDVPVLARYERAVRVAAAEQERSLGVKGHDVRDRGSEERTGDRERGVTNGVFIAEQNAPLPKRPHAMPPTRWMLGRQEVSNVASSAKLNGGARSVETHPILPPKTSCLPTPVGLSVPSYRP